MKLIKKTFAVLMLYFIMFCLVFFSKELSNGIKSGIDISFGLIIPSLFCFMIFSQFIIESGLSWLISKPFYLISHYVLKVTALEFTIYLLSLLAGYPIGARLLKNAVCDGKISPQRAENLLCYCVNCGPPFLISVVGLGIFGNMKIGLYIYVSQIVASLIIGFIISKFNKSSPTESISGIKLTSNSTPPFASSIVSSVKSASSSLLVICIFIVAFNAVMPLIEVFISNFPRLLKNIVFGLLEVTGGCTSLTDSNPINALTLITIFVGFGGACVLMQISAMLHGSNIKMKKFIFFRVPYIAISLAVTRLFIAFDHSAVNVFAADIKNVYKASYTSPLATIFMLILCIMLLFSSDQSQKR